MAASPKGADGDRAARAPSEGPRDGGLGDAARRSRGEPVGGGRAGARAIYQPLPEIPEALRRRGIEVVAVARFRIAADGSARVELTEPTADADLNSAVLESLGRWRFFPAMQDGKPVPSSVDIRIRIPISAR